MSTQKGKKAASLFVLGALLALLAGAYYLQAGGDDPANPRGNFWRVVRHGIPAYSSTPEQGHTVLIVNSGENWREIRNGLLMPFSQWLLVLALAVLGLFYKFVGPDKLEEPRTGVMIERYTRRERILHWYTAFLFIAMAVTGLSLLLGRLAADTGFRTLVPVLITADGENSAQLFRPSAGHRVHPGILLLGARQHSPKVGHGVVQEHGRHAP